MTQSFFINLAAKSFAIVAVGRGTVGRRYYIDNALPQAHVKYFTQGVLTTLLIYMYISYNGFPTRFRRGALRAILGGRSQRKMSCIACIANCGTGLIRRHCW
jgi:hypothetical protein